MRAQKFILKKKHFKKGVNVFKKIVSFLTAACLLITLSSCATIISGRTQSLPVISKPSGAIVTVGGQKQMTPATFILDKRQEYVVKIEKEGYQPVEITLKKGVSGWVFGNILFGIIGGPIGLTIDLASGSASKFTPGKVEVDLARQQFGLARTEDQTVLIVKEPEKKDIKETETEETQQEFVKSPSKIANYPEYYRLLHKTISGKAVKPEGSAGGVINVAFTLSAEGVLEDTQILDGSSEDAALRGAVINAINESAPFPSFPDDIKAEGRKTFTITIEFKYR